jgi:hypothetical protein
MYIVNRNNIFRDVYPDGLGPDHFFDALSTEYSPLPAFGCDYLGKRVVGAEVEDLFLIRYVGKNIQINPLSRYGVMSENRRLLTVHDDLFSNFERLSRNNQLLVYKFLDDTLDPVLTQTGFRMDLLDSIPSRDEITHARVNSLEMTFGIKINE